MNGSSGPNPEVVARMVERAREWTKDEVQEDQTPTQKLWRPVADLQNEHLEALSDLQDALSRGDWSGAEKARIRIGEIEVEQRQAHMAARQHLVEKARNNGTA